MPALTTEEATESPSPLFSGFGQEFQEKVLQALIVDRVWAMQFVEVFNVDECLSVMHLKLIANKYIGHYKHYKDFPSLELLMTILRDAVSADKDIILREECIAFMRKVVNNENLGDLPWVKDKAFNFCRQQLMKKALSECVDVIKTEKYEMALDIMKAAVTAGMTSSPGHDYNNDIDLRYSETYRNTISTGIPELDHETILNGGLGAGELGIVVSPSGVGKSHVLVHLGAEAMLCGKNVFFYTMELNEMYVGKRFDSHLTEIPTIECGKRIVELKDWFERNRDVLGELIIKQFPSKKITINTIRAHIEAMACKNKRPDLIIVDYAGIMRSTQKYELPRFEMQAVIQELRTLSQEFGLPLWTALQSNKEGAKSEMIDTTNMAESYGQAAEADFIMGLQRPSAQKSTGYGNLFVAKNRMGMDGMPPWKIHLNTGTSTLKVLTEKDVETMEKTIAISDEEEAREVLSKMKDSVSKYKNRFTKLSDDE